MAKEKKSARATEKEERSKAKASRSSGGRNRTTKARRAAKAPKNPETPKESKEPSGTKSRAAERSKKTSKKSSAKSPRSTAQNVERKGKPIEQEIAERAHQLFMARGGKHGYHMKDWLQAEILVRTASSSASHAQATNAEQTQQGGEEPDAAEQRRIARLAVLRSVAGLWKDRDDLPDIAALRRESDERLERIYRERS